VTTHQAAAHTRRERIDAAKREAEQRDKRNRRLINAAWITGLLLIAAVVAFGLWSSRPTQTATTSTAKPFTLTNTDGEQVSLAAYRGRNVLLYFSEGAGCQSCLVQMSAIEKDQAKFDQANVTVLPIVMNTKEQILPDMQANRVKTPFLLDDGTVSNAYGTIGKGMHAGLPGHSFVLIDKDGMQRWYGEYPSMWLAPDALLEEINSRLP
jgi:peroxiredoxin